MSGGPDPYQVLGVPHGASDAEIHAAYRAAVRRTHPDAGGSGEAFEAVQAAYEELRDPSRRAAAQARQRERAPRAGAQARQRQPPRSPSPDPDATRRAMEDLLAESQRLEDEARRLAGIRPRHETSGAPPEVDDTLGAVARDAGRQLLDAASAGARELRRIIETRWKP